MNSLQRRVTFAVCVSVGLTFMVSAGLTFLITPMSEDFGLNSDEVGTMLAIPSIASLTVIFIAGQIGDRLGHRRTLLWLSVLFLFGGVTTAIAGHALEATIGLALCGASATGIQIVALSLLQSTVPDGHAHVSAFTTYGMVYPLAYLAFPLLTAGIVDIAAWRIVPILWAVAGVAMCSAIVLLLDRKEHREPIGDWLTPLFAGLALAAIVRTFDAIGEHGLSSGEVIQDLVILTLTCGLFAIRWKFVVSTEFSFEPVRPSLIRVLLVGIALVALVGTLTFVILAMQYLYGLSPIGAAIAVTPAQLGAVVGAKVFASRAIHRWGRVRAGRHLTVLLAMSLLPLLAMRTDTPLWYLIACATLFNTAALAAVTVLNTDIMFRAPQDETGAVSSFRGAASSIGTSLGVVVLGTSILSAVNMSRGVADVSPAQLQELASGLRIDGVLGFLAALTAWAALYVIEHRILDTHEKVRSV